MAKGPRSSVNDSILESLRTAPVQSGPSLATAGDQTVPAVHAADATARESLVSPLRPTKARRKVASLVPLSGRARAGRRAPDKPEDGTAAALATSAGFTLYPKDNKRIEDAITALRKQGFTNGVNRSTIARLALLNLPKAELELARLFGALQHDEG